jgi:hypothetical protein
VQRFVEAFPLVRFHLDVVGGAARAAIEGNSIVSRAALFSLWIVLGSFNDAEMARLPACKCKGRGDGQCAGASRGNVWTSSELH